ncbi:DUF6571 family protein [Actinomyces capricornis]|uniref:DUF6571 domain-containing protein n=1 Tax=Actinomyces capricornis TaxID=2755559 RepID=A0ABN6K5F4_9ACTO|nr:DUF6571 family protein [Actinomyces capricornis]BDA64191.1 hypothetical protein MANAM107_10250 [Actinomyces capricornis]
MAYVSIDPEGVEALITQNKTWATSVTESSSSITAKNILEGSPCSFTWLAMNVALHKFVLLGYVHELSVRLDAAQKANSLGITMPAASGRLVYYLPDGVADTVENVEQNNQKAIERARQHAEKLKNFDGSEEDWNDLSDEVKKDWDNPVYANEVINSLGPEGLIDGPITVEEASGFVLHIGGGERVWASGWDGGEKAAGSYAHLLSIASVTWSEEKGENFGSQMAEAAKSGGPQSMSSFNAIFGSSVEKDVNGDGITENVGLDYNDAMLVTLGTSLEGHEESERLALDEVDPGGDDRTALPGIVHAMTGNQEAFDSWMGVGGSDSGSSQQEQEVIRDRAKSLVEKYPVGENTWTDDWASLAYQTAAGGSELTIENEKTRIAALAGVLNGLGGTSEPVDMSSGARGLIGDALGVFPEGIDESARPGDENGVTTDVSGEGYPANGNSVVPVITDQALSNLVGQVQQDEKASERLGQKISSYRDDRYQWALDSYRGTGDAENLRTVIEEESMTNGFFVGATANLLEKKAKDKDDADAFRATLLKGAANLVPIPTAGTVGDIAVSAWEITHEKHEDVAKRGNHAVSEKAKDIGVDAITARLLNAGVYSQEELENISKQERSNVAPIISDEGKVKPFDQNSEKNEDIDVALTHIAEHELDVLGDAETLSRFSKEPFDKGYDAAKLG